MINESVKIVEFNPNSMMFLKNLVMPLVIDHVEEKDDFINVSADTRTKGLLIGRNQKNLEGYNKVFKRYFNKEIKVK